MLNVLYVSENGKMLPLDSMTALSPRSSTSFFSPSPWALPTLLLSRIFPSTWLYLFYAILTDDSLLVQLIISSRVCSVFSRSVMSDPLRPMDGGPARLHGPWGSSRQEYWSGLPCPPPGDLPNSEIEPRSPALQADYLPSEPPGKPNHQFLNYYNTLLAAHHL